MEAELTSHADFLSDQEEEKLGGSRRDLTELENKQIRSKEKRGKGKFCYARLSICSSPKYEVGSAKRVPGRAAAACGVHAGKSLLRRSIRSGQGGTQRQMGNGITAPRKKDRGGFRRQS